MCVRHGVSMQHTGWLSTHTGGPHHLCCAVLLCLAALQEFELPGIGSIAGFSGNRKGSEFFFNFTSEWLAEGRCTPTSQLLCQWCCMLLF